jgi:hypothetical protein
MSGESAHLMILCDDTANETTTKVLPPILAPLLVKRWESLLLAGVAALQVGLTYAGLPGWICPIKAALGVPCPGCGLSTAVGLLLHGKWHAAFSTHAFAPIFLSGIIMVAVVAMLPGRLHREAVCRIAVLEQRTGVMAFLLLSLIFYWGLRLLWLGFG